MIPRVSSEYSFEDIKDVLWSIMKPYQDLTRSLKFVFRKKLGFNDVFFFGSGTEALYTALKGLNIKGKDIILPGYTCGAVIKSVLLTGGKPILVDVDINTFGLDPSKVNKAITRNTKAMIVVYPFGNPLNIDIFKEIAVENNIFFIEDIAQSLGAKYRGDYVGKFGDIAVLSFGSGKGISSGGGGALVVNNRDLIDKVNMIEISSKKGIMNDMSVLIKILAMYIFSNKRYYRLVSSYVEKYTISEDRKLLDVIIKLINDEKRDTCLKTHNISKLSFPVLISQLKRLEQIIDKRHKNAELLKSLTDNRDVILQDTPNDGLHAYSRFCVVLKKYDNEFIKASLRKKGIDSEIMYGYIEKIFNVLKIEEEMENSLRIARNNLCLPIHSKLDEDDIEYIASAFNQIVHSHKL